MHTQTVNTFNPDDGKQPKTFGFYFFKNFLALYIEYILISEHYGLQILFSQKCKLEAVPKATKLFFATSEFFRATVQPEI